MSKRKQDKACRRCGERNDNLAVYPSGRSVELCLRCWHARQEKHREIQAKRRAAPYTHLLVERTCDECKKTYLARASNQKFCSPNCRDLALSTWRKEQRKAMREPTPCAECGALFVRTSGSGKYCSDACRKIVKQRSTQENFLRSRYRLTMNDLQVLIEKSGNKCAICEKGFTSRTDMHIDHNHNCCNSEFTCGNCVRGLLCGKCNAMLGMANDSLQILWRAIEYLK